MNHGPNDEQLSAWLDSALPDDEQQRVEAWLSTNPEAEARVRAWAADRDALRTLSDAWLAAPVPERLLQVVQRRDPAPVWRQAAMAAGLLVAGAALGAGGLWQWQQQTHAPLQAGAVAPTTNAWVTRAAYAHAVYVAEPRHAVEVRAQEEHLVTGHARALVDQDEGQARPGIVALHQAALFGLRWIEDLDLAQDLEPSGLGRGVGPQVPRPARRGVPRAV